LQLERSAAFLPVASSGGKVDVVRDVLHGPAYGPVAAKPKVAGWQRKERGLRKLAIAFALAASLLFVAFGSWLWQRQRGNDLTQTGPTHPQETLLDRLARHDPKVRDAIEKARTAGERMQVYANAADGLRGKVRERARNAHDLTELASLYDEVVRDGILTQARDLGDLGDLAIADRAALLHPIAERLSETESEASRLATELPAAAEPLRQIARAARDGNQRLLALARGERV
jgi:hypothetical protein